MQHTVEWEKGTRSKKLKTKENNVTIVTTNHLSTASLKPRPVVSNYLKVTRKALDYLKLDDGVHLE